MFTYVRRLTFAVMFIVTFLFSYLPLIAEPVSLEQAQKITDTFLMAQNIRQQQGMIKIESDATGKIPTISGIREIRGDDGTVLAYISELESHGFVATSADTDINPIIAYSDKTSFPPDKERNNPLYRLLKEDIKLRIKALAEDGQLNTIENNNLWNLYANKGTLESETFQQWPPENTTSTGGWLETTWHQSPPYNNFCPLDPVDANRSVVGCTATALAQIVNYHRQCNIHFDKFDSYTTYSGINIDADCNDYDFPSFEQLNGYLADLRLKYSRQEDLNDTDVAALNFACGIAAIMDYSSEGSGASPYDVLQALLYKFGFYSAAMTGGLSREYQCLLQENIINQLPVVLGIRPTDAYGGHAIVCDGYNTNGDYHLNFGWGSEHPEEITEAWYRLPSDLPSDLCIITEITLNVNPVPTGIDVDLASFIFYSVPGQESDPTTMFIKNNSTQSMSINYISSPEGFVISGADNNYSNYIGPFQIQRPGQEASINVKFYPDEARGYYGTLMINYGENNTKNVILKGYSFTGGTEIQEGEVSGTWSQVQSPYFIHGDINIPENESLVVEPGVQVMFVGPYSMTIGENAQLLAEGTKNQPIEFSAWNKNTGWTGLRFLESGDDDVLNYCRISYSKKTAGLISEFDFLYGGGDEDSCGGAVYCYDSSPTITNCKITNNIGDKGGAIYCLESYPIINNTVIANNASMGGSPQCGGIFTEAWGAPDIKNCTIVNNSPGGIFTASGDGVDMTNTIIWGNERYQIQTDESVPVVTFCNVQGGYPGSGNIDSDPNFFAPSSGPGTDYDGLFANWTLSSSSPCINAGTDVDLPDTDLADNPRIFSDIVDIGAYENQSELPLITVNSSIDAEFINLNTGSTVSLDIMNTGQIEFKVESLSISDVNGVFSVVTQIEDYLLAPGESIQAEIGFTPTEESIYNGTFYIHSTCSNAPNKQVSLHGVGVSGTIIPGGEVSGSWTAVESPYTITGDIHIPRGRSLNIEPGVTVKFAGHFGLTVGYRATLRARGSETDPIVFTPIDTDEGWYGIRFVNSGADDVLEYCTIEYAKKPTNIGSGYLNLLGGGILCCSSWEAEPMFGVPSSPTIDHCLIANNYAFSGGGILCMDDSEAVITNNTIVDNSGYFDGGAINVLESSPEINNNIIAHNSALDSGGIQNWYGTASIINNTIVHNRPNGLYLGPTPWTFEKPLILNNIIWQNEIYVDYYVWPGDYDICFNDIQGGFQLEDVLFEEEVYEEEGNINTDPYFADPQNRDYHLKSEAGQWDTVSQTWIQDDVSSPCIDAGDPDSDWSVELSPNGERINMGAYGGTTQASMSISTDNIAN